MFDDLTDSQYMGIAAKMVNLTVPEMEEKMPKLVERLNMVQDFIRSVKPYGTLASSQVIAAIIAQYFVDVSMDCRMNFLEVQGR